jgi:hypothetical protein
MLDKEIVWNEKGILGIWVKLRREFSHPRSEPYEANTPTSCRTREIKRKCPSKQRVKRPPHTPGIIHGFLHLQCTPSAAMTSFNAIVSTCDFGAFNGLRRFDHSDAIPRHLRAPHFADRRTERIAIATSRRLFAGDLRGSNDDALK